MPNIVICCHIRFPYIAMNYNIPKLLSVKKIVGLISLFFVYRHFHKTVISTINSLLYRTPMPGLKS